MKHLSLFNGIGGFQLAAEWVGWENVASVEIDKFCNKVTKYHFPNCKQYEDIKEFDGKPYRGIIDIISGGFPCQPYSQAGKRLGKADERHLWPEMLRIIHEIQPGYVVGENVRGITNWNGGMVFDEVQADLESEGYEVLPFLLPASAVNAPHRRDRIWFVAYANASGEWSKKRENEIKSNVTDSGIEQLQKRAQKRDSPYKTEKGIGLDDRTERSSNIRDASHTNNKRFQKQSITIGEKQAHISNKNTNEHSISERFEKCNLPSFPKKAKFSSRRYNGIIGNWENFPTESPICGGNDGLPDRLDGITFSKWRNESIKGYGNAIVPQVAFEIFKAIQSQIILKLT